MSDSSVPDVPRANASFQSAWEACGQDVMLKHNPPKEPPLSRPPPRPRPHRPPSSLPWSYRLALAARACWPWCAGDLEQRHARPGSGRPLRSSSWRTFRSTASGLTAISRRSARSARGSAAPRGCGGSRRICKAHFEKLGGQRDAAGVRRPPSAGRQHGAAGQPDRRVASRSGRSAFCSAPITTRGRFPTRTRSIPAGVFIGANDGASGDGAACASWPTRCRS